MRIRCIRLVLPSRFRADGVSAARAIGEGIARAVAADPPPSGSCTLTVAGGARPAASIAGEAGTRAVAALSKGRTPWR